MITVSVLDNNKSHNNLCFCVEGLTAELWFDTYYFEILSEHVTDYSSLKDRIALLLEYWVLKTCDLTDGQEIFLPIDFSDEYTAGLKIKRVKDQLVLAYGDTKREGHGVDPTYPGDFCHYTSDFGDLIGHTLEVSREDFVSSVKEQVVSLRG